MGFSILSFTNYILFSTELYYELESWIKSLCTAVYGGVMINGYGLLLSFMFRQRSYIMEITWSATGAVLYPIAGAMNIFHHNNEDPITRLVSSGLCTTCGPIAIVCGVLLAIDLVYNILERKWAIEDKNYFERSASVDQPGETIQDTKDSA
ncbi:hypothetical protein GE061_019615 [Apolygus lucorum]|uniref:Uncharacterized protein n=1 Tax=Apolygus lucorum TaxID=248454 RepID=A0A6A4JUP7_APOLU|nr:hypothetical protein GE061_019615 [Apolygus lucorum]